MCHGVAIGERTAAETFAKLSSFRIGRDRPPDLQVMRIVIVTSDGRGVIGQWSSEQPSFGTAPASLLQGCAEFSEHEFHVLSCIQRPMKSVSKLAPNIFF